MYSKCVADTLSRLRYVRTNIKSGKSATIGYGLQHFKYLTSGQTSRIQQDHCMSPLHNVASCMKLHAIINKIMCTAAIVFPSKHLGQDNLKAPLETPINAITPNTSEFFIQL